MRNLAGAEDAAERCAQELSAAGVKIILGEWPRHSEVKTRITGKVGGITLTRAWRYWRAKGLVPLDVALRLYEHPVGRREVRVAGHCMSPPPKDPWLVYHDEQGEVSVDPSGEQEAQVDAFIRAHPEAAQFRPRFVRSKDGLRAFVGCYHIDSAEGLKLFADAMKVLR
jgi:hypothetical protein